MTTLDINKMILQTNKNCNFLMLGISVKNGKWIDTNEKKEWYELKVDRRVLKGK